MIKKCLIDLGFTDGESKAYLALCELGSSTVGPIVKRSKIAYANIYAVLRRLEEKGLATHIIKGKTKIFSAAPPEELKFLLRQRKEELVKQQNTVNTIIPEIKKLQGRHEPEHAEVFLGFSGLRAAYSKMIEGETEENIISIYKHEKEFSQVAEELFYEVYNKYPHLKIRVVADEAFRNTKYAKKVKHLMKYTDKAIPSQIDVLGSKSLIISWQKPVMATLIIAKPFADNFKKYFNDLWEESIK